MSKQLRFALLDPIWAHSLEAMQAAYRQNRDDPLTAHELETMAVVFNELVHHWALNRST
jgi:hypothetical protein